METFYFTLGVLSVLIIIGIFGMVKVWNKISKIEFNTSDIEDYIGDTADDLSEELEKLHSHYENEISRLDSEFREESEELGKMIDSRFDKYDNIVTKRFEQLEGTIASLIVKNNR